MTNELLFVEASVRRCCCCCCEWSLNLRLCKIIFSFTSHSKKERSHFLLQIGCLLVPTIFSLFSDIIIQKERTSERSKCSVKVVNKFHLLLTCLLLISPLFFHLFSIHLYLLLFIFCFLWTKMMARLKHTHTHTHNE